MMMAAATDKRASVDDFGPFAVPPPPSMHGAARTNPATTSQPVSRHGARADAAAPATVLPPTLTRATLLSPADVLQLMGALDASAASESTARGSAPRAMATTAPAPGPTRVHVAMPCQALSTHAVNPAAAAEQQRDPVGGHHRGPVVPPPIVSKAPAVASLPTPCPAAAVMPPLVASKPAATPMLPPPLLPSPASSSPAGSPAPVAARALAAPSSSSAAPSLIDLSPELSPSAPPAAVLVPVACTRTSPLPQHAIVPLAPSIAAIQAAAPAPVPSVPAVPQPAAASTADTTQYPHDELQADDAADALGHALAVSAETAHVPIPLAVDAHLVLALQLSNDYIDMYSRAARTARRAVPPADLVVAVDEDDGALLATTPAAEGHRAGSPNGGRTPSVRSPTTAVPAARPGVFAAFSQVGAVGRERAVPTMPSYRKNRHLTTNSDSDDDNVPPPPRRGSCPRPRSPRRPRDCRESRPGRYPPPVRHRGRIR
ncbi:hypothetical protein AMAG_07711 [Allomyces macrogynus ATCC 38327]|uniref:Uncharacterized protein n=1 Tax=Allomyces macrogynus (strain ATCC 38327) TaxID=578462 RepID=A0A0L0SJ95_ALLM3|nr:hypothetical protein AMAG_07711 [Allomyces macrogynus ATCC 38327]|eukprot:KNE62499.1 hypothetical protein AMAG_07711 [Allomyces macrogynus ATCC 38327]